MIAVVAVCHYQSLLYYLPIKAMSSSSSQKRVHHRHHYQMLPSKDNGAVNVADSPEREGSEAEQRTAQDDLNDPSPSMKAQFIVDLKPQLHRNS